MTCPSGINTQGEHNDDLLVFEPGLFVPTSMFTVGHEPQCAVAVQ